MRFVAARDILRLRTKSYRTGRASILGAVPVDRGAAASLMVVHVYREEVDGKEITRILSARRAHMGEVRRYQKQENGQQQNELR